MKMLRIKQCPDPMRWYSDKIGELVPYCGDVGDEYKSREPAGFTNFVQYADAYIEEFEPIIGTTPDQREALENRLASEVMAALAALEE